MSEGKPVVPKFEITQDQLERIGGGDCTPEEWLEILSNLKDGYETLVDFTSYVIERVGNSL